MVKSTKILTNQRGKYTIILTKGRVEATFFVRQRARDWRGLVRSATEHRSEAEPRKARPPAAWRNRHLNDILPLPSGDAPKKHFI